MKFYAVNEYGDELAEAEIPMDSRVRDDGRMELFATRTFTYTPKLGDGKRLFICIKQPNGVRRTINMNWSFGGLVDNSCFVNVGVPLVMDSFMFTTDSASRDMPVFARVKRAHAHCQDPAAHDSGPIMMR